MYAYVWYVKKEDGVGLRSRGVRKKERVDAGCAAACAFATTTLAAVHARLFVYPPYDVRASRSEQRTARCNRPTRSELGWQKRRQSVPSALTRRMANDGR